MKDFVFIDKLRVPIRIGCFEEERDKTQDIEVSIKIFSDSRKAAITRDVNHAVCYKTTSELILSIANEKPFILLEEFGELVISSIFERFKTANAIEIAITKFVIKEARGVGVSMTRIRN